VQLRQPGCLFYLNSLLVNPLKSFTGYYSILNLSTIKPVNHSTNTDPWLSAPDLRLQLLGSWLFLIAAYANRELLLRNTFDGISLQYAARFVSMSMNMNTVSEAFIFILTLAVNETEFTLYLRKKPFARPKNPLKNTYEK
jgi:hypothetical protein